VREMKKESLTVLGILRPKAMFTFGKAAVGIGTRSVKTVKREFLVQGQGRCCEKNTFHNQFFSLLDCGMTS